jgi:hypothetical protein
LSLEEFPPVNVEKLLKDKGYSSGEIHDLVGKDVLFLSDPAAESPEGRELLTLDTVIVKKTLSNEMKDLEIEFPLDKEKEHRYLELLAAEIYIGFIVFLTVTAWEVCKGIIANYVYDKFKSMKKESKTLHAKVEIQIIDKKKGRTYHFKYSGPADKVSEIIKKAKFE